VISHHKCLNCDDTTCGSYYDHDYICFKCGLLSRNTETYEITKDQYNWWIRYPKSTRGNEWSRLSIDQTVAFDEAYSAYINRIMMEE